MHIPHAAHRFFILLAGIIIVTATALSPSAMAQSDLSAAARGAALFETRCAQCHSLNGEALTTPGPTLDGVFNRRVASTKYEYSRALREGSWNWNSATLDRYLRDPSAVVPGTTMQAGVPDAQERRDIITFLASGYTKPTQEIRKPIRPQNPSSPAFTDWRLDQPGTRHQITLADLPPPYEMASVSNPPKIVKRPLGKWPIVPEGFEIRIFAEQLEQPTMIRAAPNGDLFVAETSTGRIRILRPTSKGFMELNEVFAQGLNNPYGIAFYPLGPNPTWVYVAETNRVVRYPYQGGETKPSGPPQVIVASLSPNPSGGGIMHDLVFSRDGQRMFVSVGAATNAGEGMPNKTFSAIQTWESTRPLGAAWGHEENRANILVFMPDGGKEHIFATGLRNCVALAINPNTGELFCSGNERNGLGDNLVPDYVTRIHEGAFFGWPWWYFGGHEDPRWVGVRPDLVNKISTPDVLIQPHSAAYGIAFYNENVFPKDYRGTAFVALNGSQTRSARTGYKVVRLVMYGGEPTGEYEDFLTGFVLENDQVWARPAGLTVNVDGALYMTDDANGTVWRISYPG